MDEIELSKELIAFDTTSPIYEGEIFAYLENLIQEYGITAKIHSINGVKSLTARINEGGEPKICFSGHLDVVDPGHGWEVTPPFHPRVQDGKLYGRGAADMKTGMAAMFMAFLDLNQDPAFNAELTIMATGDEERGGFDGTKQLLAKEHDFDYAIVGEPTGLDIQVGTRGILSVDIVLQGELGHSSRPHLVHNVADDLPEVIAALRDHEMEYETNERFPDPTSVITFVSTDMTRNSIPGSAHIGLDIRYLPSQNPAEIVAGLKNAVESTGVDFRIEYDDLGGAFELEDMTLRDTATSVIHDVTGGRPSHITEGGSSDGRYFTEKGIPHIELGVDQETGHQRDEHCDVKDIMRLRTVYARLAKELASAT